MFHPGPAVQSVADTAWWVASFRAVETNRNDALFRDPLAGELAGARYTFIARALSWANWFAWATVVRTYMFDRHISEQVRRGVDTVVNLGAGLDARPYRMDLPKSLLWI